MTSYPRAFTLMELLMVIAILAVLATLGIPLMAKQVSVQRLRGEAQNVASFMRQARLMTANTKKPVRVSLQCPVERKPEAKPCRLNMETANYIINNDDGKVEVDGWTKAPNSPHELARVVFAYVDEEAEHGDVETPHGWFWIIFMPGGRSLTYSFPNPFKLDFRADDLSGGPFWRLIVNSSGQTTLTKP